MPEDTKDRERERDTRLNANFDKNQAYAKKGDYQTPLNPASEQHFRLWLKANKVPFDPNSKVSDYDMRGFWLALQSKDPRAVNAINPNDQKLHYPDFWKTPYHASFSNESQWAIPGAPSWNKQDQLVLPNGAVVFDERAQARINRGSINAVGTEGRRTSHQEGEQRQEKTPVGARSGQSSGPRSF